ncbi:MAG: heat-inducible transcription repressor HrcA [Clostridia bacterium]|nr:heat-inducible transcription repressor HrcA [Clostridia bacterium]
MNLSERKKKILEAVIDESATTSEPVSSKQLQENYLNNFSSSTIRSELATLEELGLLYHPHTSSGRLPTLEGIKFYLEEMVPSIKANASNLINAFDASLDNVKDMLKNTAKKISEATNYTSIMSLSLYDFAIIENVKFLKLDEENALVALITNRGAIRDVINLNLSQEELDSSSKMLSDIFKGKTLRQIENSDFLITKEIEKYKFLFETIVLMVTKGDEMQNRLAIEGKSKLFEYPEFSTVDNMKSALNLLYEEDAIADILSPEDEEDNEYGIKTILETNENSPSKNCAIVTANLKLNDKTIGKVGVLGPLRMDYKNVISILKGLASEISEQLSNENNKGE